MTVDEFVAQVVANATIPPREVMERIWRLLPAAQPGGPAAAPKASGRRSKRVSEDRPLPDLRRAS